MGRNIATLPFAKEMSRSSQIALLLPSLRGGGAERAMLGLAMGLADRGIQVDLVLVKAEGEYLPQVPKEVRLVDLNSHRTAYSLLKLVRYLRRERPAALSCPHLLM